MSTAAERLLSQRLKAAVDYIEALEGCARLSKPTQLGAEWDNACTFLERKKDAYVEKMGQPMAIPQRDAGPRYPEDFDESH